MKRKPGGVPANAKRHQVYMRLTVLQLETERRLNEAASLRRRLQDVERRLVQLNTEEAELLGRLLPDVPPSEPQEAERPPVRLGLSLDY